MEQQYQTVGDLTEELRMGHSMPSQPDLETSKIAAIEQLVAGATLAQAAEAAGVSRQILRGWCQEDWSFQAALNDAKGSLLDAAERSLLAAATRAIANVRTAVEAGNLDASIALLKGLGLLGGSVPPVGSTDAGSLREAAAIDERQRSIEQALLRRSCIR